MSPNSLQEEPNMKTIELSYKDRLMLINQFKIIDLLNRNKDHELWIEALEYGFDCKYSDIVSDLSPDIGDKSQLVYDILDLYREINYYKLSYVDDSVKNNYYSSFGGFDANHEQDYLYFSKYLFKQAKYAESAACGNGWGRVSGLSKYVPMLKTWKAMGKPINLKQDQVLKILNSQVDEMYAHTG